ncbi:hypothetical protein [Halobaculum limi]|uniref:hypothetical protein n=1 Tax=Halobaculum limi TaxID=3031916 RepID=UPI0024054FCA|nr:hypothetical protein [Halobaculum sp. YSMS11]
MRPRTHVLSVLVVLALAIGAQAAYTDVGREIGGDWSEPTELSTLDGSTAEYPDVAVAGDGDRAVVAWVEADAGEYRVRIARLAGGGDRVRVQATRTLFTSEEELREVDAAVRGDRVAVAVEDAGTERIVLLRGRLDGEFSSTTVSTGEAARVESVDVAALEGETVVGWRAFDGDGFTGKLAVVTGGEADTNASVDRHALPGATTGRNSPALSAAGDGRVAVAWADEADTGVYLDVTTPGQGIDGARVGDARRGASSFSSANLPPLVDVTAGDGGAASVLAWTDLSVVHVAAGGADVRQFGSGNRLRVAGDADDWTAIWTVADRTSGRDVVFARGGADVAGNGSVATGHVSRLPSNALAAAPGYLGGEPTVAWVERGGNLRLLVSGYTGDGPVGTVGRLTATPFRFGFVAVVAVALAVVTVPLLPWVAGPLLAGFLLTTRTVLSAVGAVVARLAGVTGRSMRSGDVRSWIQSAPGWVALAAFVPLNLAVFAYFGRGGVVPGVPAVEPFGLSALALAATLALAWLRDIRSSWRLVFAYGYCQSVALWAAAAPAFL